MAIAKLLDLGTPLFHILEIYVWKSDTVSHCSGGDSSQGHWKVKWPPLPPGEDPVYIYWKLRDERAQWTLVGWGGELSLGLVKGSEKYCRVLPVVQNSLRRQSEQDEAESGNHILKEMIWRIRSISLRKEASGKKKITCQLCFNIKRAAWGQHYPEGRIIAFGWKLQGDRFMINRRKKCLSINPAEITRSLFLKVVIIN